MSLVLGIPGDNVLCSPGLIYTQGHHVLMAVLMDRKRTSRRGTPGKVNIHGRCQWAGMSLECIYPFADSNSPLLQALLQAHLQSQGPE